MAGSFAIINLGCKVNKVEADSMAAKLLAAGARQCGLSDVELVLINTCTVTGEADAKSRKALRRALREAPLAEVIICGCGATTDPSQFYRVSNTCHVIPNKQAALEKAAELLGLGASLQALSAGSANPAKVPTTRTGEGFNTRVAIKVQDGCNHACTYCIVPKARGRARSTPLLQALQEIEQHVEAGAREIVLTGIDLGSYAEGSHDLVALLTEALALKNNFRLRLSSIELPSIKDELIQLLVKSNGRVCAHLHIPLQSGSERILKEMARRYSAGAFLERVGYIRRKLPFCALTTDVIVGFPGESEEDFAETMELCREAGFSRIHIFRYSKRATTVAAKLPHQIQSEVAVMRAKLLDELGRQLAAADQKRRVGTSEAVLVESAGRGRSESYHSVLVPKSHKRGELVTMTFEGCEQGMLTAKQQSAKTAEHR